MDRLTKQGVLGLYWNRSAFLQKEHLGFDEDMIIDRLAYYEDLEEQGRMVILPHPVGQAVWVVRSQTSNGKNLYIREERIDRYIVAKEGVFMCFESGRTSMSNWQWEDVYISREEAERKLMVKDAE